MPVNVAAAPENCTLRPLALTADSTNCNCSSSSTLLSVVVTMVIVPLVCPAGMVNDCKVWPVKSLSAVVAEPSAVE